MHKKELPRYITRVNVQMEPTVLVNNEEVYLGSEELHTNQKIAQ